MVLPEDLRKLLARVLSSTEEHGAPLLQAQLASARLVSDNPGVPDRTFAQFDIPKVLARAVPGTSMFPIIGRFSALDGFSFDLRLYIENGHLAKMRIEEGADWTPEMVEDCPLAGRDVVELRNYPASSEVELLVETSAGYQPLTTDQLHKH
ncbi:hypothetical protein [Leucobacter luti]|nr:hypothetical protein [Leucobacter luti]